MAQPTSIAGQILSLYDQGYSPREIAKELKIAHGRVQATIKQSMHRSVDSRRLFEVHEMVTELLAIGRELLSDRQKTRAEQRRRLLEKYGRAEILGHAIERAATRPSLPGSSV